MASARSPREPLVHPDPQWWLRWPECKPRVISPTDPCHYCGHARVLHGTTCSARSTALMGFPDPCQCDNKPTGSLYHSLSPL